MRESDDEDYVVYGTPLEPIEEDEVPRKKPIYIQDQIATDKQGRRRFHGAFTGGFSAGFYNTVGTPEGWLPAAFKSSREKKADLQAQRPEDFMDEEDTDQFGIAPSVLRAKPEYSGSDRTRKRERVTFSEGPIPGDPVLHSILRPAKETIGVQLLMKMGWKPGQGIGPRLTKLQKKKQNKQNQNKVYGCYIPGKPDSDSDEEIDVNHLFAPDDVEMMFVKPKTNRFGMGYTGLDKNFMLGGVSKVQDTFRMMDNNKKLAIKGQAFGVGAFEDEDADIYARDDMSNYDFSLETVNSLKEKRRKERKEKKMLAITSGGFGIIDGFVLAKKPPVLKKYFPPPKLPPDYNGVHAVRKTRFGPEHKNLPVIKSKHLLTASDRAAILEDEKQQKTKDEEVEELPQPEEVEGQTEDTGFRPFISDPAKQARYERYLHFVKIGAKEAFEKIQPKVMTSWEKERERNEFEQASRLYKPLSGMMADRFASAELPDESLDPLAPVQKYTGGVDAKLAEAAKEKKFGKLTRSSYTWIPVSLLCKRMNIAEPMSSAGTSLCEIADEKNKKRKVKFNAFDFLADKAKAEDFFNNRLEDPAKEENVHKDQTEEEGIKNETGLNEKQPLNLPPPDVIPFEDPEKKIDLFKAIFCSDEENEEEEEPESNKNALRNTSPPRGIFANLDLDALKAKPQALPDEPTASNKPDPQLLYGPSLPAKPVFFKPTASHKDSSDSEPDSSEDEWVEKGKAVKEKKDEKKKHKKHKKESKKEKHKSKKKSSKKKSKH
ncbi:G patch domain-containing protein 1 homolog [Cimex lectularius]|uniref:G-patch domain-containing protein n=1 Tax=Cimex lectularius TaxID=79782 RepID=A0A8I6RCS8_CIMLE|nr:G patch domain-containing protein 1 homolog [Cimex lectularius]